MYFVFAVAARRIAVYTMPLLFGRCLTALSGYVADAAIRGRLPFSRYVSREHTMLIPNMPSLTSFRIRTLQSPGRRAGLPSRETGRLGVGNGHFCLGHGPGSGWRTSAVGKQRSVDHIVESQYHASGGLS